MIAHLISFDFGFRPVLKNGEITNILNAGTQFQDYDLNP
jgi:hypothetical protein